MGFAVRGVAARVREIDLSYKSRRFEVRGLGIWRIYKDCRSVAWGMCKERCLEVWNEEGVALTFSKFF